MKKILFTLLLVAGMFGAKAQTPTGDTISFFYFSSTEAIGFGDLGHSFSEGFTHCNDNVISASSINVYDYNNTTGILLFNGVQSADYSTDSFFKPFIDAAFAASNNDLLSSDAFGAITGTIATTANGDTLTR